MPKNEKLMYLLNACDQSSAIPSGVWGDGIRYVATE